MAFHPSVDENAPGFWVGYYKGLGYILWGSIIFINLAIVGRNFFFLDWHQALETIQSWYQPNHVSFYYAMGVLFVLGALSFVVDSTARRFLTDSPG